MPLDVVLWEDIRLEYPVIFSLLKYEKTAIIGQRLVFPAELRRIRRKSAEISSRWNDLGKMYCVFFPELVLAVKSCVFSPADSADKFADKIADLCFLIFKYRITIY